MDFKLRNTLRKIAAGEEKNIYDQVGGGEASMMDSALDVLGSSVADTVLPGTSLIGTGFSPVLAHLIEDGKDGKGLNEKTAFSLVPGVGKYRNEKRHMYVDNKLSGGKNVHRSRLAETLGTSITAVPLMAALATVGAKMGADSSNSFNPADRHIRGILGAAAGAGIGMLPFGIAKLVGFLRKRRTNKEHKEYLENGPLLSQYLIPGVAAYQSGRRARMAKNILA